MSVVKKLRKGFDIKLAGKADPSVVENIASATYAVKPSDFVGYSKPKLLVKEGDTVKAGSPLYYDKTIESVMYNAPVSGTVEAINRGEKRRLLEIVIKADGKMDYESFPTHSPSDLKGLNRDAAIELMSKGGVWPHIVQRPYAIVANPADTPKAIHISCFDTHPLSPNFEVLFKDQGEYFKAGVEVLKKLTSGVVHLNMNAKEEVSKLFSSATNVQVNKFSGPHPAGNVGVQIHHIDPIGKGETVWTVAPYGVIQIGKLFVDGKYDASKVVALAGSEVKTPKYYQTYNGACIDALVKDQISGEDPRYISGNVLTGEQIEPNGYVGFYDNLITVIPEGRHGDFFGSFVPTKKLSFHRAIGLLSVTGRLIGKEKEHVVNTNINGEHRPFVQTGSFERVVPMDIFPVHLLKAIMAEDFEEMEALGIFEVAEEDFALCEFIDTSKTEVQSVVREGLELMRNG